MLIWLGINKISKIFVYMIDKRSSENYDEINIAFINFYLYKSEAL